MEFVETRSFSARVQDLLSVEELRSLQTHLLRNPEAGDLMAGTGGFRKLRWSGAGRGKRGGVRVVYFVHRPTPRCLPLAVYGKNEQGDLTQRQKSILKRIVAEEYP